MPFSSLLKRSALVLLAAFWLALPAQAEDVYVVHAIPGTAIGQPSDTLAVDIDVSGGCAFTGVEFGNSDSAALAVGHYDATISLSDGACGGAVAVVGSFTVALGETAVVIAHLNEAGAPTLTKISVDASPADTRVTFFPRGGRSARSAQREVRWRQDQGEPPRQRRGQLWCGGRGE